MFDSMHRGEDSGIRNPEGGKFRVDDWNDRQVAARRTETVEAVLAEAARARETLKVSLMALTEDDVAKTLRFGGDSKRPPAEIPLGWCEVEGRKAGTIKPRDKNAKRICKIPMDALTRSDGLKVKFDAAGSQKAKELLQASKKADHIRVDVVGVREGDVIKVTSISPAA